MLYQLACLATPSYATQNFTTETDLTSLSLVNMIPSGGRKIKITAPTFSSSAADDYVVINLKEGSTTLATRPT